MNTEKFAEKWINAWNSHNLENILEHYTDDFEITTPMIKNVLGNSTGTLKGKEKIREYWSKALKKFPDLNFQLLGSAEGVNSIVLWYRSVMNLLASEVMFFNEDGKVYKVIAHYSETDRIFEYEWLKSVIKRFSYYKSVGENAMKQIPQEELFRQLTPGSNSIAIIVNHLSGNMLSRWTNFLTSDGEKEWRDRDSEFENIIKDEKTLTEKWDKGWEVVLNSLQELTPEDVSKNVLIRGEAHSVIDAVNRQLSHYAYHIGQIVFIAKLITGEKWQNLTIPKGKSREFNEMMKKKRKK